QRDVRTMAPEFCEPLLGGGRLGNQRHVRLGANNLAEALPENRVILDAQNPNGGGGGHRFPSAIVWQRCDLPLGVVIRDSRFWNKECLRVCSPKTSLFSRSWSATAVPARPSLRWPATSR